MKQCAEIIVTYNRKNLLEQNITALLNQTYKEHDIIVIDNASTDGTKELIESFSDKRIIYYNTGENLGGAGGFSYGLEKAIELGYEYAWIMDDDSIPETEALESLIKKSKLIENKFSFIASLVYWTDGTLCNMNIPEYKYKSKLDIKFDLIRKYKIMPIDTCSFVGCFVNLKYAEQIGLPISEFFIYGDDVEYTLRLRKVAPAYLDLDSIIIHKTPYNQGADIATADENRISRYFYQSRNGMYIARKNHTFFKRCVLIVWRFFRIVKKAPNHKLKRIYMLIKGSIFGLFFNPKIKFAQKLSDEKMIKYKGKGI